MPNISKVLTSDVTVSASTAKTTILSLTVPANVAAKGQVWECMVFGEVSCPSDATPGTFDVGVEMDGFSRGGHGLSFPASTAVSNSDFFIRTSTTFRDVGVNGTISTFRESGFNFLTPQHYHSFAVDPNDVDTSTTWDVTILMKFSQAAAGYTATAYGAFIRHAIPF